MFSPFGHFLQHPTLRISGRKFFCRIPARRPGLTLLMVPLLSLTLLSGCESMQTEAVYPEKVPGTKNKYDPKPSANGQPQETIFGPGGLFSTDRPKQDNGSGGGIGVNSFLWRASLDTLSFMPLASADPFGGVIITDWYSPPSTPDERFKATIYILDRRLRADGLKASLFHQRREGNEWRNVPVARKTVTQLEDTILTRARELRRDFLGE